MKISSIVLKIFVVIIFISFFKEPLMSILGPFFANFKWLESITWLFSWENLKSSLLIIFILLALIGLIWFKIYRLSHSVHKNFIKNEYSFIENIKRLTKENKNMIGIIILLLIARYIIFNFVL